MGQSMRGNHVQNQTASSGFSPRKLSIVHLSTARNFRSTHSRWCGRRGEHHEADPGDHKCAGSVKGRRRAFPEEKKSRHAREDELPHIPKGDDLTAKMTH